REKRKYVEQDPANIVASEIMGKVHDDLEASGYTGHKLEVYLVRLLFMLFADDTGIFEPRDHLLDVIENRTNEDGSDLGMWLHRIFEVLNTPEDSRSSNLDEDLNRFPYVNGDLFSESLAVADFTSAMRENFLEACRFNWQAVSPAIFGSLFQSVMDPEERRKKGAHYTTEKNIMKVIGPLFLDHLRAEFEHLKGLKTGRAGRLEAFRRRLGTLTFLDPACGCGNFLIIAYRELRKLELEIMAALREGGHTLDLFGSDISVVDVDQFYGIEFEEFPARIAEVAMWMIDHIMNREFSSEFGLIFNRIPLRKSPHIRHADALELDWNDLLPAHQCAYVMGNPPFLGKKEQSTTQKSQVRSIFQDVKSASELDYVSCWFAKAGGYLNEESCRAEFAFVATNSITQGEQVAILWPVLFHRLNLEISFAHRTFEWGSEARGKAHVHVVIVGLTRRDMEREVKRLFSYENIRGEPEETIHKALTAYLFGIAAGANRYRVVAEESSPINGAPRLKSGVQMLDKGLLTFETEEMQAFVENEPASKKWFRAYLGGDEYINGFQRYILYLRDISPTELRGLPMVGRLVAEVRKYRGASSRPATKKMASTPTLVGVDERPTSRILVIPNTSSERRHYVPMGWLGADVVANQKLRILPDPELYEFAVLTSSMHMAWLRSIGGRMKSDPSYTTGIVYNTFPWPQMNQKQEVRVSELAQAILDARDNHPGSTLADLYDPDLMPPDLRKAHTALDKAVDRLYRAKPFESERERVEHLFMLYEEMVAPMEAEAKKKRKRA
ncbi:MAG: class I SAM-dependent DNA methyltransferase, partial [Nitratireductor sp.]|nr:class I SAM-dependent DNA methyltransferase [Nitratireductor sp.]